MYARLVPGIRRRILDAAPTAILADAREVAVLLDGFEARPERLQPLLDLAEMLATEIETPLDDGPYR